MMQDRQEHTSMRDYAQSYAEVISRVTGVDVEIMDNAMIRIAGTGVYAAGVGESLTGAGEIYKEVLRTHKTILVESPRSHPICARCPDRNNCKELFTLGTPIVADGAPLGVIGFVCFNAADRSRVLQSLDSYTAFISFLADALAYKVSERTRLNRATQLLDLMLKVVDAPGQGVMIFGYDGNLFYSNQAARDIFHSEPDDVFSLSLIEHSGSTLYGMEEFEVSLPGGPEKGKPLTVLGRMADMSHGAAGMTTLFSFELPTRVAFLAGELASTVSGGGFDTLIGASTAMKKLKENARQVAGSRSTVLITGESGTGKELLARAIHQASARRDKPFVAINCGGIPDTLLESELFGYVSGAFTGASNKGRMGKFELAEGGVIFLDEISTMPLYLQVKLLRVLQERVITRLGSNRPVHIDVRVIAASNENLEECIARNSFREDLYYRLNVIPLEIPPLRERSADVPILADYFLDKYCALFGKSKLRLRGAVVEFLEGHSWPGNVRELEHVMEYAVNLMPDTGFIGLENLPAKLLEAARGRPAAPEARPVAPAGGDREPPVIEPLSVLEERAIRAAILHYGDSTTGKKRAARALGLSLATLYRKLTTFSK